MNNTVQRKVILASEKALNWLELAKWAPSGGNAQPWLVEYEESFNQVAFRLTIDPEYRKNPSLMDVLGTAAALALGSLTQNLILIAETQNYKLIQQNFDDTDDIWSGAANLLFEKDSIHFAIEKSFMTTSPMLTLDSIKSRHTHRGIFNEQKLPTEFKNSLDSVLNNFSSLKYNLIEPGDDDLYRCLSVLEQIRWQNKAYLRSLLSEIGFAKNESDLLDKISSSQLGVSYFDQLNLKVIKKFISIGSMAMNMGMSALPVMKSTRRFVMNCQQTIFIQVEEISFKNCFELGRCFQQLWLTATTHNVSFQPNGNALIALGHWLNSETIKLSRRHIAKVIEATETFNRKFGLDLKKPVMGFRIGFSDERMERSLRKPIQGHHHVDLIQKLQKQLHMII